MSQGARLEILRPFQVTCGGRRVAVSTGAQRLPAFLALRREGTHRRSAAEQLWPDCTTCRAAANLRPALCQGRKLGSAPAIDLADHSLVLAPLVLVDFHDAWDAAADLSQALPSRLGRRRAAPRTRTLGPATAVRLGGTGPDLPDRGPPSVRAAGIARRRLHRPVLRDPRTGSPSRCTWPRATWPARSSGTRTTGGCCGGGSGRLAPRLA